MTLELGKTGPAAGDNFAIDLRRLRYFIAVCDHGSISRAASIIGMAQPALTRQIQLLEKETGLSLIHRTGRGAEPSQQGRFLLDRSRAHIESLDTLVRDTRQMFSLPSSQILLGICPTIAPFFLDDLMIFMRENHPNATFSVIEAYSGDLQNLMTCNRLDLALTYRPGTGVECIELFSERLVLVSGHAPENRAGMVSLAEMSGLRLILPSGIHELRRIIDRVCKQANVQLTPDLELDSLEAVKATLMKKSSHYFTVLPYHSVSSEVENHRLDCRSIDDAAMQRTIAVILAENPRNPQVLHSLLMHIRATSKQLRDRLDTLF